MRRDVEREAFRAIPKHSLIVDREGRICATNDMATRLFPDQPCAGGRGRVRFVSDIFDVSREEAMREIIFSASGGALQFRRLHGARDGEDAALRFRVGAIRSSGPVPLRFVLVSESEDSFGKPFRALNAELDRANELARRERHARRLLQRLNEDLEASNSELKSFSYAVSHDLKSPIHTVAMLLSELETSPEDPLTPGQAEIIVMCRETLSRMSALVEDLLRYTQLIGTEMERGSCDLNDVVDSVIADLRGEIHGAGAEVRRGDLPVVSGDEIMLRVLFQNLISNAVKFRHPERPPVVSVSAAPQAPNGQAVVAVRDNGLGIAPKHRDQIFKLFGRLHRQDEIPGSGLGLTMCRRIARGLGGNLELEAAPDCGSVFTLRLERIEHE